MLNIDPAVQAAMTQTEKVLSARKTLQNAITTTMDDLPKAEGALERASLAFGAESTAVMLDGATAGGASHAFADAREHLDLLNAPLPAVAPSRDRKSTR